MTSPRPTPPFCKLPLPQPEQAAIDFSYTAYESCFVGTTKQYKNLGVVVRNNGGPWPTYGATFHHLVTKDQGSNRTFCPERGRRVHWPADTLDGHSNQILIFPYKEASSKTRIYFYEQALAYVTILEEYESY